MKVAWVLACFIAIVAAQCEYDNGGLANWSTLGATAGQYVVLTAGQNILLNESPPTLGGIEVQTGASLVFADMDIDLTLEYLWANGGTIYIGDEGNGCGISSSSKITITLVYNGANEITNFGSAFVGASAGSTLVAKSDFLGPSWTTLAANIDINDDSITLSQGTDWQVGDSLVVASTDFDFEQAEEVTIVTRNSATEFVVSPAFTYRHWGSMVDGGNIDMRAEVAKLNRPIVIQSANTTESTGIGGHTKILEGFTEARWIGVEFTRMGQSGIIGTYPVHYHQCKSVAGVASVVDNSVHHCYSRCYTVHDTNDLTLSGNIGYHTIGHCFFIEDGSEENNVFDSNLGFYTLDTNPWGDELLLPTDSDPATFWVTNPNNILTNNHAAGGDQFGYWFALPEHPTGPSFTELIRPRRTALGQFSGNIAHSYRADCLFVDRPPDDSNSNYAPLVNDTDTDSDPVVAEFMQYTAYKCRNRGMWTRGTDIAVRDSFFADNAIGVTHASNTRGAFTSGCRFVGESENIGTPEDGNSDEQARGRTLPKPWDPTYPIRGFEFYDGPRQFSDSSCGAFVPNSFREASCISVLRDDRFSITPDSSAENIQFDADGTREVYFPDFSGDGAKSIMFDDLDGSVSGNVGHKVMVQNPFLTNDGCYDVDDWKASVCPGGQHGAIRIYNNDFQADVINSTHDAEFYGLKPHIILTRSNGAQQPLIGAPVSNDEWSAADSGFSTMLINEEHAIHFTYLTPNSVQIRLTRVPTENETVFKLCIPSGTTVESVTRWSTELEPASSKSEFDNVDVATDDELWFHDTANETNGGVFLYIRAVGTSGYYANMVVNGGWTDCGIDGREEGSSVAPLMSWLS